MEMVGPHRPNDTHNPGGRKGFTINMHPQMLVVNPPTPSIGNCETWTGYACTAYCETSPPPPGFLKSWVFTSDHTSPNVKFFNDLFFGEIQPQTTCGPRSNCLRPWQFANCDFIESNVYTRFKTTDNYAVHCSIIFIFIKEKNTHLTFLIWIIFTTHSHSYQPRLL